MVSVLYILSRYIRHTGARDWPFRVSGGKGDMSSCIKECPAAPLMAVISTSRAIRQEGKDYLCDAFVTAFVAPKRLLILEEMPSFVETRVLTCLSGSSSRFNLTHSTRWSIIPSKSFSELPA